MPTTYDARGACSLASHIVLEWIGALPALHDKAETPRWWSLFARDRHPALWPFFAPYRYTTDRSAAAPKATVEAGHKLAPEKTAAPHDRLTADPGVQTVPARKAAS